MRLFVLVLFLSISWTTTLAQETASITLTVNKIKKIQGKIMVCLCNNEPDFLKDCFQGYEIQVEGNSVSVVMDDVPLGTYVINIYHDVNSNEDLDTNFLGIPKEPYGFSNNARGSFGPPNWEKCTFKVEKDIYHTISL